jgi:hypothetical protein
VVDLVVFQARVLLRFCFGVQGRHLTKGELTGLLVFGPHVGKDELPPLLSPLRPFGF